VAFVFYLVQVVMLSMLGFSLGRGSWLGQLWAVVLLGLTAMFIFGVHGMLSGTASMDFGGRKAAATVAGALDGVQYIGSGLTGIGLGWILKTYGWDGVAGCTRLLRLGVPASSLQPGGAFHITASGAGRATPPIDERGSPKGGSQSPSGGCCRSSPLLLIELQTAMAAQARPGR
jgi:hypothetical protein